MDPFIWEHSHAVCTCISSNILAVTVLKHLWMLTESPCYVKVTIASTCTCNACNVISQTSCYLIFFKEAGVLCKGSLLVPSENNDTSNRCYRTLILCKEYSSNGVYIVYTEMILVFTDDLRPSEVYL